MLCLLYSTQQLQILLLLSEVPASCKGYAHSHARCEESHLGTIFPGQEIILLMYLLGRSRRITANPILGIIHHSAQCGMEPPNGLNSGSIFVSLPAGTPVGLGASESGVPTLRMKISPLPGIRA